MKKIVIILLLLGLGYWVYTGPARPLRIHSSFSYPVLKKYEEMKFKRGQVKKGDEPIRSGKVLVAQFSKYDISVHGSTFELPRKLQAVSPEELETLVKVTIATVPREKRIPTGNGMFVSTLENKTMTWISFCHIPSGELLGGVTRDGALTAEEIAKVVLKAQNTPIGSATPSS